MQLKGFNEYMDKSKIWENKISQVLFFFLVEQTNIPVTAKLQRLQASIVLETLKFWFVRAH